MISFKIYVCFVYILHLRFLYDLRGSAVLHLCVCSYVCVNSFVYIGFMCVCFVLFCRLATAFVLFGIMHGLLSDLVTLACVMGDALCEGFYVACFRLLLPSQPSSKV